MSTDPITLIADTIRAHRDVIGTTGEPPEIEVSCTCGQSVMIAPDEWAAAVAQFARHRAEAVVAALTQAGHMLPPDTEMTVEHGYRYRAPGKAWRVVGQMSAEEAELRIAQWYRATGAGFEAQHVSRTAHTSPWQEVSGRG